MWVHCDLIEFITLMNKWKKKPLLDDILHFFGQEKFIFFREKSGNLKKVMPACGSHMYMYFYVPMK